MNSPFSVTEINMADIYEGDVWNQRSFQRDAAQHYRNPIRIALPENNEWKRYAPAFRTGFHSIRSVGPGYMIIR